MSANKILEVNTISKTIVDDAKSIEVLNQVSFDLEPESFTTIIGPSGCGKSTLLRIIAGLESPSRGKIINDPTLNISFVFQSFALFPYLTVAENIEFGLKMTGVPTARRRKRVNELIDEIGLNGFENQHPSEISGGMRQRVGIARALAMDPQLLLLDEPFSALDEFTAESLRHLLVKLWKEHQMTVLMVTHLIQEAVELSDQIIVMSPQPGTVIKTLNNPHPRPRNLRSHGIYELEDELTKLIKI